MSRYAASRPSGLAPASLGLVGAGFASLAASAFFPGPLPLVVAAVCTLAAASLASTRPIEWRVIVAGLLVVILFIPIRRFIIPGDLPFQLEPYRILVALMLAGWLVGLLVDPRIRLRRSIVDGPMLVIALAILGSVAVNAGNLGAIGSDVVKALTFFASFLLLFYLIVSVVRTESEVAFLLKLVLAGGAVMAVAAVVEYRTGFNAFDRALQHVPLLEYRGGDEGLERGADLRRAFGSAEHPIALGAALAMMIPIALYVAGTTRQRRWWFVGLLLVFGVLATVSRTSILVLAASTVAIVVLRPSELKRVVVLVVAVGILGQIAVPGSIGTLRYYFNPPEGLVAQQQSSAGSCSSAGRIADIGPALREYRQKPVFGQGFGSRIPTGERANACILDNQWLGSLLEVGTIGLLGFLWLFSRFTRRLAREARRDKSAAGWLPTALVASVVGYAVGMLTFDAFSFVQVTLLMFIFLGLGAAVVAARRPRLAPDARLAEP